MVVASGAWSAHVQSPFRWNAALWIDGREYVQLATQFASGQRLHGEHPYPYRVGAPWLAAALSPADPPSGFLIVNVVSGAACALLLMLWLRRFIATRAVRLIVVGCFCAMWISPVRFVYFNALQPDPLFMAFAAAGLLSLVCVLGTLVRETMLVVPLASLFADNPLGGGTRAGAVGKRVSLVARFAPFAIAAAAVVWTHFNADASGTRTFTGAVLQQSIHKPVLGYVLAWFTCFGPIVAVVLYDWKSTLRFLTEHQFIAVFGAACAGLAYVGGADTERYIYWTFPAAYLLIARSMERLSHLMDGPLIAVMAVCQTVSARLPWPLPIPSVDPPALMSSGGWTRLYNILDRLFVINHFYYNLFTSFGSAPFRLLRLAVYLAVAGGLILKLRLNEKNIIRPGVG